MNSLIINFWNGSGFFSNFLIWIDILKYCDKNNLKPIMKFEGDWFYSDGRENLWDYYFEKLNDGIPIGSCEKSNFLKSWDITIKKNMKTVVWDSNNEQEITNNRIEVNKITERIIPVERIRNKIESFVEGNFKGKNVLGLHIRGTDYGFNNLDLFYERTKNYKDYDCIFVASDNFESINFIKNNFSNVFFYDTDIRTNTINDSCLVYQEHDKLKHGEDVLIECHLLSKCNHLICTNSNVALTALYLNPNMTYDLIYRSEVGG